MHKPEKRSGVLKSGKKDRKSRESGIQNKDKGRKGSGKRAEKSATNTEETKSLLTCSGPIDVREASAIGSSTSYAERRLVDPEFLDSLYSENKKEMTVDDINNWLKILSRWRKDMRGKERDAKERRESDGGKVSELGMGQEEFVKSLPKRFPRVTPRMKSNIQLVPPRTSKSATSTGKEMTLAEKIERKEQTPIQMDWKEVVTKRKGKIKKKETEETIGEIGRWIGNP